MDAGLDALRAELHVPVAVTGQPRFEHASGLHVAHSAQTANLVSAIPKKRVPLSPCRQSGGRQEEARILSLHKKARPGQVSSEPVSGRKRRCCVKQKTRRRKTVGGLVMGADWGGCKLQTLQTLVCSRTLGECRARAPRIGFWRGRTPFASGRSPNRHRCPEDSRNTTSDRPALLHLAAGSILYLTRKREQMRQALISVVKCFGLLTDRTRRSADPPPSSAPTASDATPSFGRRQSGS